MGDNQEEGQPYKITVTNPDGTKSDLPHSYGFTGEGTAVYPNNEIYEGSYENGQRNGKGTYTYIIGDKYEGDWKANKKHGIGKMEYRRAEGKNLGDYYGFWENGKKHGEGMFTYPNKDIYSGWWKYGKKHGKGTYVFFDTKMRLIGDWSEGQLVTGKWVLPNGAIYEGEFKNNKPNNKGKWTFKNGNTLEGKYIQHQSDPEEPTGDEEEGAQPKVIIKTEWISDTCLGASAELVNSLQHK